MLAVALALGLAVASAGPATSAGPAAPRPASPAGAQPVPGPAAFAAASLRRRVEAALRATVSGGPRAAAATRALVGAPYAISPLGEGKGRDPDRRFRLDAFDCMTFVETAVALGSSGSLAEAQRALDDVRYDGAPALAARAHEVLSQWIPRNLEKGWIVDATALLGDPRAWVAAKEYTPESWAAVRRAGRAIAGLPRARLPLGRFDVLVMPPEALVPLAGAIPEGAVVFVVRADRLDRATRITHAGLVVWGADGSRRVRHATSSVGVARVIEERLDRFLAREVRAYPRWPVEGIALFTLPDNRARVTALRTVLPETPALSIVSAGAGRTGGRAPLPRPARVPGKMPRESAGRLSVHLTGEGAGVK
jgi:N-acetylmuramoyl-L-alanine amidase-like protein